MFSINKTNFTFIILLFLFPLMFCSVLESPPPAESKLEVPELPAYLKLTNQSQFDIEHFYIYPENTMLGEAENLLSENIAPQHYKEFCIKAGNNFVTATRKKNQDGPLLAFSLASPYKFNIAAELSLEFLENEFRMEILQKGYENASEWINYYNTLEAFSEETIPDYDASKMAEKINLSGCVKYENDVVMLKLQDSPCVCPWDGPAGTLYHIGTFACTPDDKVNTDLTLYKMDDEGNLTALVNNDDISTENSYSAFSYYLEAGDYYIQSENTKYEGKGCYGLIITEGEIPLNGSTSKTDDNNDVFDENRQSLEQLSPLPLEEETVHYDNDDEGGDDWFKITIP